MEKETYFLIEQISKELKLRTEQVKQVINLLDDGSTIPFIARYRKEMTGSLDETVLRDISERIDYLRNLNQRKIEVINLISEQGKLTEAIKNEVEAATVLQKVEDIYRPFKPKRKTRASVARDRGLEPFSLLILDKKMNYELLMKKAIDFVSEEKELYTIEDVLKGGQDIVAEMIADDPTVREWVRNEVLKRSLILTQGIDQKEESVYEMYYDYQEALNKIKHHRILAINRGEKEKILKAKLQIDENTIIEGIKRKFSYFTNFSLIPSYLDEVVTDSYKRLIFPSVEREVRQILTENAEKQAIHIFSANLRQLLLQPPIKNKTVLGIDPAFRTGCKMTVISPIGRVEDISIIYPNAPHNKVEESKKIIKDIVDKYSVEIIVIGNGTASRETEQLVVDFIKEYNNELFYIIVSEAGASVYSASKIAKEEFPKLDVSERSAISIARRLQDPLAELVKIDPKSVGVGQYQHDVSQKELENSLTQVVESVVNYVGVDVNTASVSLLQNISGMNKSLAKNIVSYREKNGRYNNREMLKEVARFGPKIFEQAAGFLRIDGENVLDKTSIHPESYSATFALLERAKLDIKDVGTEQLKEKLGKLKLEEISSEISIGLPTLKDIVENLIRPFRDPREELPKPILSRDILKIEDLQPGISLKGTVRNIVDFGTFVDLGVKEDGLVHISEMSDNYIKHPLDVVSVGDIIDVSVLSVDINKKRIALTMKA